MERVHVVIAGGGIAGVTAALAAAAAGARTVLVRTGPGATALATGAWTGTPPGPLRSALASGGLTLEPAPVPLPHPDGRLVPADVAPSSQVTAGAAVAGARTRRVLICGITGLPWFRPRALARLWAAARDAGTTGDPAAPGETGNSGFATAMVTVPGTPAAGWAPAALAALLDRDPDALADGLHRAAADAGASHAILPAVVGLDRHAEVRAALESDGVVVGEALGVAPSLPGWRLDRALMRALADAGVETLHGRARAGFDGGPIVHVSGSAGTTTVRAAAVILATGRFVGGGIAADPHLRDPVADLPVRAESAGRSFRDASESLALTVPDRRARQPLLEAGIAADPDPESGLFIAGDVRRAGGPEPTGLGHAATDGWRVGSEAGRRALEGTAAWR
ncbi:MAG TPA: FAD-binding protein [Longimicrobiales bacterium]|nr:FAD-binding protein [Longimicrobiales bacterium]